MPPVFPALKGAPLTTGPVPQHIDRVMNGKQGTAMVAFKDQLNDQQIADVVTYERNAWGNNTGTLVTPEQIKAARQAGQSPQASASSTATTPASSSAAVPAASSSVQTSPTGASQPHATQTSGGKS